MKFLLNFQIFLEVSLSEWKFALKKFTCVKYKGRGGLSAEGEKLNKNSVINPGFQSNDPLREANFENVRRRKETTINCFI